MEGRAAGEPNLQPFGLSLPSISAPCVLPTPLLSNTVATRLHPRPVPAQVPLLLSALRPLFLLSRNPPTAQ
eukprot:14134955-Alexandrium_andersonii.AAC.1